MTTKISGANISSIGNTGVNWNAVTVADGSTQLNVSAGNGYILDTNTGVIEVFLPTSPIRGDTIILVDYAGTFAINNVIVNTGTTNLDSTSTYQYKLTTNDTIAEFVYIDSAKGWITKINTTTGTTPSGVFNVAGGYDTIPPEFIAATGGTVTTSGNYKIHVFTGDGCFAVSQVGNPQGSDAVDYLVVAGGGSGGAANGGGGGGGAGGFRVSNSFGLPAPTTSPLASPTGMPVSVTTYPITVGGGGSPVTGTSPSNPGTKGNNGSNSVFSTITSTGGGGGGGAGPNSTGAGNPGGSGGGEGAMSSTGGPGTGNTPPTSPPQGNPGGAFTTNYRGSGGGGAGAAGSAGAPSQPTPHGPGGVGLANSISGSPVFYSGGGGGSGYAEYPQPAPVDVSLGGNGGGGPGKSALGTSGTTNTGGGGGGGYAASGGAGGSGIVIVRSPVGAPLSASPCTNTVSCVGGATVATFTVSGTLTVN